MSRHQQREKSIHTRKKNSVYQALRKIPVPLPLLCICPHPQQTRENQCPPRRNPPSASVPKMPRMAISLSNTRASSVHPYPKNCFEFVAWQCLVCGGALAENVSANSNRALYLTNRFNAQSHDWIGIIIQQCGMVFWIDVVFAAQPSGHLVTSSRHWQAYFLLSCPRQRWRRYPCWSRWVLPVHPYPCFFLISQCLISEFSKKGSTICLLIPKNRAIFC